jgi:drug/metabolite transporter (DMT)-like permease
MRSRPGLATLQVRLRPAAHRPGLYPAACHAIRPAFGRAPRHPPHEHDAVKTRDLIDLVLLGALWGASFLFMRISAPEFGPVPLIELRVATGALVLLPILAWHHGLASLGQGWKPVWIMGVANSALPFCCFAYATLTVSGGFAAIINSSSPLWGALFAWLWLGERLGLSRVAGLLTGFGGVLVLVQDKVGLHADGASLAVAAALFGAFMYGFAANFARRYLAGIPSLAVATGTQIAAAVALAAPAFALWPQHPISAAAWWSAIVMGIASTGIAFILYFRLIANVGAARALAVTYLVPVFGMLWSAMFLHELPTPRDLIGCAVILLGTALATGLVALPARRPQA